MKIQEKRIIINDVCTNYTITNTGIVYSLNYNKTKTKKALKQVPDKDGYLHVTLHVSGKQIFPSVARLVATAFIPLKKSYIDKGFTLKDMQVNHKKGGPDGIINNTVTNLEWVTPSENIVHAYKNGLAHGVKGEDKFNNVYSEKIVREICKDIESNMLTFKEIRKKYNVRKYLIESIYYRRTWTHISKDYDFSKYTKFKNLSLEKVHKICKAIESNEYTLLEIAEIYQVAFHIVKSIYYGQTWKSVSKDYNFSNYNKSPYKRKE